MDRLEGIKIFVRVVESGSFSAVARELGTGQPAISKQIAALEERLGAQLLMRTSRSLSLTEAGRDFYESAVPLISDLEAAESRIGSGQASPSGVVRVTAAPGFSRLYVVPKLPSFRARYPKVVVEMLVSERTSNLVEEGIDLAIRNGALSDSSLVARKIGESAVVAVASAEYLERRGEPTRPSDLDRHDENSPAPRRSALSRRKRSSATASLSRACALLPMMERSISNSASIRRTTSIAIGDSATSFLPAALRRAFFSTSAMTKKGRRACDQQAASRIGPGVWPGR